MECKCGGDMFTRTHTKDKNLERIATLEYDRCTGCGRNGNYYLREGDSYTATGDEAIRRFEKIAKQ
mgnify:CR=1 FL=1